MRASPVRKREVDLVKIKVRDDRGEMVPLGAFAKIRNLTDIPYLRRIDGKRCMLFTAEPAPGLTQLEAQTRSRQIAQEVIDQMGLSKAYQVLQK